MLSYGAIVAPAQLSQLCLQTDRLAARESSHSTWASAVCLPVDAARDEEKLFRTLRPYRGLLLFPQTAQCFHMYKKNQSMDNLSI